ncbi:MAG: F0F1 ATP synthase subunit delta [Rhizomicrobium sp.]
MHIDWWTLALQTINVLILVWLLGRFFYQPVVNIIEKRRVEATKLLAEGAAARAAANAEKAGIAAVRQGFAAEREKLLADARMQAEAERDAVLKQAAEAATKLRADGEAGLARDRAAMQEAMVQRASTLAADIARKLLERLPEDVATMSFLNALSQQVQALSPKTRMLLAEAKSADVITAVMPTDPLQAQCRKALEGILGTHAKLTFRCDPSLIAGVEIRSDVVVLRNNWRDDLVQILKELGPDNGQHQTS